MLTSSNPHKTKGFRTPPVPMVTRNTHVLTLSLKPEANPCT